MRRKMVSVVIPVYNGAETITDALDSVACQTALRHICEVVVVDDGSTDDTVKTVKDWRGKKCDGCFELKFLELKRNTGVSAARNKGVEASCGEYLAFLDADDEWMPEKLEIQLGILKRYPKIKALGTGWDRLNLKPGRKIRNRGGYELYRMGVRDELMYFWPPVQSLIIRRDVLAGAGGFNENMRRAEDSDLLCRLAERGELFYLPDKLVKVGHGKNTFGEKGLSADLKGMHRGFRETVRGCLERESIGKTEYAAFLLLEEIKYLRRILLSAGAVKEKGDRTDPLEPLKSFAKILLAVFRFLRNRTFLKSIELQIVDHCNLNCRGCAHFSNISEKRFTDARVLVKTLDRLNQHIGYIYSVAILGGEPLLHPDIVDIIGYTRDRFPISEIRIVTNGLLLDRMPEEFYKACRKNRILIYITKYPPTAEKIPQIKKILSAYGIRYFISSTVRQFAGCFDPEGGADDGSAFGNCSRKSCRIIKDDRLYMCSVSAFVDKYNARFNTDIPRSEGLDLYNCTTGELLEFLKRPVETCRYCTSKNHYLDWSTGKAEREDWNGGT